jgi:L-asparaginase / beta-aspartyl-peptidase
MVQKYRILTFRWLFFVILRFYNLYTTKSMKKLSFLLFFCLFFAGTDFKSTAQGTGLSAEPLQIPQNKNNSPIALVIHGGAGTITRQNMTPEKEKAYKETLTKALQTGYEILKKGGTSLDAVEATIRVMEDSPLFNAGKGAVFTHEGKNEMDAAIMNGQTLEAGAVASVQTIKNPITLARRVMDSSPHVMMVGSGAEEFAKTKGVEIVDPSYFYTETRWNGLQKALQEEKIELDHNNNNNNKTPAGGEGKGKKTSLIFDEGRKYGTVGACALDQFGNLAAATSTGGMTNKRYGRVGDAPIIGCGTYANNNTCAVSATGHGEFFIRSVVAYDVSALMEYKKLSLKAAANEVVMNKLVKIKGEGGLIALDRKGNIAMPFNSEGMYRGFVKADGKIEVAIYKD